MTSFQPKPGTLAAAVIAAHPPETSVVSDGMQSTRLTAILAAAAALPVRGWTGRSVLIATDTQLEAAAVVIALDGVARRLVLAPPDLGPQNFAAVVRDAEIDTVICGDATPFANFNVDVVAAGPTLPALPPLPITTAGNTQWLMLTSGTTGEPKIAMHSLVALTGAISASQSGGQRPVWATFYDIRRYGGLQIFLRAMLAGGSLILSRHGEAIQDHLSRLASFGVTHISGTPTHWRRALMSEGAARFAPRVIRLSGEIADQTILDSLKVAFPNAAIGHAYASTEAGVGFEVNDGLEGFPAGYLETPVNGVAMRLANGALQIKSARTASGYAGQLAAALADADGWVDTGDMIEVRGGRCHFAGRRGGIINVGGLKVHPEEVESVINRHSAVRQSRVKPRKSPLIGAIVVADVVLAEGTTNSEQVKQDVLSICRANLPPHKIPAIVNVVADIEMTAGGKVARAHA